MKRYIRTSCEDILYKFKVGQQLEAPMLYGGTVYYEVVSRTPNTVTIREYHISEDSGKMIDDGESTKDIILLEVYDYDQNDIPCIGQKEAFETWSYHGHTGYCSADPNAYG